MALTYFLPTDISKIEECCYESHELAVGDAVDSDDDDLEVRVVAYYPYYPLALNSERVALAIIHPADEPLLVKEAWYCWQVNHHRRTALHILRYGDETIRVEERKKGDAPEIGKEIFEYCIDGLIHEPPKLDWQSLTRFMAKANVREHRTGLAVHSYTTHRNPDAPFKEIYLVELAQVAIGVA